MLYCKIEGIKIPLVSCGTSPFFGAGQFGTKARIYRKQFFRNTEAVLKILEACYEAGGRGIGLVPGGKISEAARIMKETHDDFIITGSTFPGPDPMIDILADLDAKIIFAHGSVSDKMDDKLVKMLDDISSRGIIPGVAVHNPVNTLEYVIEKQLNVKAVLVPFNAKGFLMANQKRLEEIVNNEKRFSYVGMKTLAAGKLDPKVAYDYIARHNICAVTIGMVEVEEAKNATKIALEVLQIKVRN